MIDFVLLVEMLWLLHYISLGVDFLIQWHIHSHLHIARGFQDFLVVPYVFLLLLYNNCVLTDIALLCP